MSVPDLVLEGHTDLAEFALGVSSAEPLVASGGRDTNVRHKDTLHQWTYMFARTCKILRPAASVWPSLFMGEACSVFLIDCLRHDQTARRLREGRRSLTTVLNTPLPMQVLVWNIEDHVTTLTATGKMHNAVKGEKLQNRTKLEVRVVSAVIAHHECRPGVLKHRSDQQCDAVARETRVAFASLLDGY